MADAAPPKKKMIFKARIVFPCRFKAIIGDNARGYNAPDPVMIDTWFDRVSNYRVQQ